MDDGKHCPRCGEDIGVWSVFAAGLPVWIKCPKCGARLSYMGVWPLALAMLVLLAPVVWGSYQVAWRLGGYASWRWVFAALVILAWTPIELAMTFYLRARRRLKARPAS